MQSTDTKHEDPQSLEQWTRVLCEQEMPIFSNTAQHIYNSLDNNKGAMELASIILQDPNLTTKLLKVSNSIYYNPSRQKISTVSRAIVILGSKLVRELTIACSFFESIISPENKYRANQEIGHAIHAAVQAKEIAIQSNDSSPEEVFVAALLNNIGQISFWCFGGKQCQYITELVESGNFSAEEAENKVLGFSLTELGKGLCKTWSLGGLIEQAILKPEDNNSRVKQVLLGKEIIHAIDQGWDSEQMKSCIKKIASLTNEQPDIIKSQLKKNTESAVQIASKFGAHDASQFIKNEASGKKPATPEISHFADEKQIQFHILQDITQHISGSIDLNLLFEMVIEGIHRGLHMDRTVFCLLSADKKTLNEKLTLGWLKKPDTPKIKFEISSFPANLFFHAIESSDGIWSNPERDSSFFTPHVINSLGTVEGFLIPIRADNKAIGLIYTDRSINKKPLTEEDFKIAKYFSQQAIIGLALFKIKKQ